MWIVSELTLFIRNFILRIVSELNLCNANLFDTYFPNCMVTLFLCMLTICYVCLLNTNFHHCKRDYFISNFILMYVSKLIICSVCLFSTNFGGSKPAYFISNFIFKITINLTFCYACLFNTYFYDCQWPYFIFRIIKELMLYYDWPIIVAGFFLIPRSLFVICIRRWQTLLLRVPSYSAVQCTSLPSCSFILYLYFFLPPKYILL